MKNEFTLAFNEVLEEKQLPKEVILKALESAMVSAYRKAVNASGAQHIEAKIDIETGKVTILAEKEVVETVQDPHTEVSLEEARKIDPNVEIGQTIIVDSTPKDFGRVAAQTARQVIQQRIRDAERQMQLDYYQKQLGEIVSGIVQAVTPQGLTIGLELRAEGTMPRKEMIPGERFRVHDRVRALVAEVKDTPRGPQIILSRTHKNFLRRLLETEVPEIYHGIVEIRSIAREPGERAKVAVSATQPGVDPVGACVGIRGVRIQAIVRELHDEKIDVIEWNPDPAVFIAKALSPARVTGVYLDEKNPQGKTATVVVPEDQLSLAIGRDGQNARLAARLTGWRIDIKSLTEAAADALHKLQKDPAYAVLAEQLADQIPQIEDMLARKAEGRPLTPEEYDTLSRFVDRVERRVIAGVGAPETATKALASDKLAEIKAQIPPEAFETNILDSGLPEHVAYILQEAGYTTVGEMAVQMKVRPEEIFRLNGIGPRAMQEINKLMARLEEQMRTAEVAVEPTTETEVESLPAVEASVEETVVSEPLASAPEIEATPEIEPVAETTVETPMETFEEEPEEEISFDQLFTLKSDIFSKVALDEDEEEEEEITARSKGKKKAKKKKKPVALEYDPDRDQMVIRKKHKREDEDWDEWEL
ncbi:transcription termination factor NusA [Thermanaerothrix sp. 4228-RoL]|uniref:Transcription termination/antitermination protein NusA n=1 Tax=Thermanaerothrix solaris TaxID=3058434 RepID=A0ABU3NLX0_9CHLR|nr:transcription termination factor NusA [Thermanaerothrix sp. 4228-RoL]MDT8897819.1 transcription termination factor NusA [Thermanaerothrix sp. 4228-RoL]